MARYYNQRGHRPQSTMWETKCSLMPQTSRPLAHHYLGPYLSQRKVGQNTYQLQLPQSMNQLHPIFNMVKLLPVPMDPIPGWKVQQPPSLEIIDGEEHYVVEKILYSQLFWNQLQFLVKWEGYGYEENSWASENDILAPDKVQEFYDTHPGAPQKIFSAAFHSLDFQASRTQHSRRGGDVRGWPILNYRTFLRHQDEHWARARYWSLSWTSLIQASSNLTRTSYGLGHMWHAGNMTGHMTWKSASSGTHCVMWFRVQVEVICCITSSHI